MDLIMEIKEVNMDPESKVSQLVLYSSIKGSVRGIFNSESKLNLYNLLTNEIDAIEVLTNKGRDAIKAFYRDNPNYIDANPEAPIQSLI